MTQACVQSVMLSCVTGFQKLFCTNNHHGKTLCCMQKLCRKLEVKLTHSAVNFVHMQNFVLHGWSSELFDTIDHSNMMVCHLQKPCC